MTNPYKTHSSSIVHENPWFKVRKDIVTRPNGEEGEYFVVSPSPGVAVVPINDKGEVTLVQLFRYHTQTDSIEIPAGGTDGEEPLTAAKRELQEETGLVAKTWTHLGHFQMTDGMTDQWSDYYLAQDLSQTSKHDQLEEGIERTFTVPLTEALRMIADGRLTDIGSVAGLYLASALIGG